MIVRRPLGDKESNLNLLCLKPQSEQEFDLIAKLCSQVMTLLEECEYEYDMDLGWAFDTNEFHLCLDKEIKPDKQLKKIFKEAKEDSGL